MKLTKNTIHYKFWKANYGYKNYIDVEPNENFCDYFWQLVWAVILSPIVCLGLLWNKIDKNRSNFTETLSKGGIIWVVLIGLSILGVLTYQHPIMVLKTLGMTIGGFALIIAIFWITFSLTDSKGLKETKLMISEGWSSFKGKYCPRIDWN